MSRKTYRVLVSRTAEKFLKQMPAKERHRVVAAIQGLSSQPFPIGSKKITGEESTFRIRTGNYRVIYEVDGLKVVILILKIGHRKDVYR